MAIRIVKDCDRCIKKPGLIAMYYDGDFERYITCNKCHGKAALEVKAVDLTALELLELFEVLHERVK